MLFELFFEALEQRKRICCAAGKTSDDLVFVKSSHFASIALHNCIALRDLPIPADYNLVASADRDDRGAIILFQVNSPTAAMIRQLTHQTRFESNACNADLNSCS
jgi:hypothetical protein